MTGQGPHDITALLRQLASGDVHAEDQLIPLVYTELRQLASNCLRSERSDHTLQSTALVHEAYLRLAHAEPRAWQNRAHFFAVAAKVMRRILVDHARARNTAKRGAGDVESVGDLIESATPPLLQEPEDMLALDRALNRLASLNERQARIVELRFFGGLTVEEAAHVLSVSPRTVKREWHLARAWLYGELS